MLRRSKRLLWAQDADFPSADVVFHCADLIFQILFFLDWPSLLRFSRCSQGARRLVQQETTHRVRQFLRPFITADVYLHFMDMLRSSESAIAGGIPYCFLTVSRPKAVFPSLRRFRHFRSGGRSPQHRWLEMDLLVIKSQWDAVMKWFLDQKYDRQGDRPVPLSYGRSVSQITVIVRPRDRVEQGHYYLNVDVCCPL